MIVLISGNGKYAVEGEDLDSLMKDGRVLFDLLKKSNYEEFTYCLNRLHEFVKKHGKVTEIYRPADIILPPLNCDPRIVQTLMGIQKKL